MSDLKFVNTSAAEIYNEIISELEKGVSEPLSPGDERRIFGEALVSLIVTMYSAVNGGCRQKMLRYARGDVLDALGENRSIARHDPIPATVKMRFSVNSAYHDNIIIPSGTHITGDYVRYFTTDQTVVLMAGTTYIDVSATSIGGGENFNSIPIGDINTLVDLSKAPLIDKVENVTATSGGGDREGDTSYRDRIRNSPNKLSTAGPPNAYRYWAMDADPAIADAVVESPNPGVVVITPIGYGGFVPDAALLEKVLQKCSADEVRPLTDQVVVQAPTVHQYDIELVYYTTSKDETSVVKAVEASNGAIGRYTEWQGSALDRDLNPDYLRKLILSPDWEEGLVGAERVEIIKPVYTPLNATTVAKFSGNLTVSHDVRGK